MKSISPAYQRYFIIIISTVFYFSFGINSIHSWSITYDEGDHYNYAIRSVKGHPEKVIPFEDGSCMPVSMINTIPRIAEQAIHPGIVKSDGGVQDHKRGRYMTLIAGFFILLLIYAWLSKITTKTTAAIGFALGSICPNIISQSSLVTTDAYAALFFLATLYFLHQWYYKGSTRHFMVFSLAFACTFLVKQSLMILIPICFVFVLARFLKTKNIKQAMLFVLLFCCINLLVLNIGFQFNYADHLVFKSENFKLFNKNVLFNSLVVKVLPTPFLQGIDEVMYMDNLPTGDLRNLPYIFINGGFVFTKTGCPQFFFQTLIFKTPLLFLTGWMICLATNIKNRKWDTTFLFCVLPLAILLFFTFFVHSKVGVRHILIIYPFIIMSAAIGFSRVKARWYLPLVALHIFMLFTYRNNLLAYTNEFVTDNRATVNLAGTVNVEYNQSRKIQPGVAQNNICTIDSITRVGDTLRLQVADFFYITDSLHNKSNIFKNYTVLKIDKNNTVQVVKTTAYNKITR